MEKSGFSIERVAVKAGYKRITYYTHIKKENLSLEILKKYGKVLDHDFSKDIPQIKNTTHEGPADFIKEPTLEEVIMQREMWRKKYDELIDKHHELVAKYHELLDKYLKLIEPAKP